MNKINILTLLFSFYIIVIGSEVVAQQGVVAAGGDGFGIEGSVSFSAGLPDFVESGSSQGSVSLGLQHVFILDFLSLEDIIVINGDDICFNAKQTITLAGNGTIFNILAGGNAEVIAGSNIIMYDGFKVYYNGLFHARITQTNDFCTKNESILEAVQEDNIVEQEFDLNIEGGFFNAFPNPTTGILSIEVFDTEKSGLVEFEVFTMQGNLIKSLQIAGMGIYHMDISNQKSGIYIIRAIKDYNVVTRKIIKL